MTKEQIEKAERRAWIEKHFHDYGLSDEEVMSFKPLPSENFSEGFKAGVDFALSNQWVSVEERLPEDDRYFYLIADSRKNPLAIECVEYSCETQKFSRNGIFLRPTHWCAIPKLNDKK